MTARAKGLSERSRSLRPCVSQRDADRDRGLFRPRSFGSCLPGALLIEVIFSLDGLGLLGFEAAINRDYPVMFATLYFFTLLGLLMGLIVTDLTYAFVDGSTLKRGSRSRWRFGEIGQRSSIRGSTSKRGSIAGGDRRDRAAQDPHLQGQPPRLLVALDLLALFFVTLFAEFIANDKPLLLRYEGAFYFPAVFRVSRDDVRRVPRDRGGLFGPRSPGTHRSQGLDRLAADSVQLRHDLLRAAHARAICDHREELVGTDDQARDVVARLIYGFRISVLFGLTLTLISSVIGIAAGAVQGYFGGRIDLFFQRFIEIWSSLPTLYLLIILASIVQPNFWWLLGLLLLFSWTELVRVVRAEFLRTRNFDYVRLRVRSAPAISRSCSITSCRTRWWRR